MKKLDIIKKVMAETGMRFENTTPEKYAKTHTKIECEQFADWCRRCVMMDREER